MALSIMRGIVTQIRLEEERNLLSFMEGRINASIIRNLLSIRDKELNDGLVASYFKEYKLSASCRHSNDILRCCADVTKSLGITKKRVEVLFSRSPAINAASFFNVNHSRNNPHFIIINPVLLKLLDEQELSFVIGHEMGHLIYEHTHFRRVIQLCYPDLKKMPYLLRNLFNLWCKLGELSADRAGLIAAKRIDSAASAMYKLSSGPKPNCRITPSKIIDRADKMLKGLPSSAFQKFEMHPADPIRIKALEIFYQSNFWRCLAEKKYPRNDGELTCRTDELVSRLKKSPGCAIEEAELEFLAAAGYLLITSDKSISDTETDYLNNLLSKYLYLPQKRFHFLSEKGAAYDELRKNAIYLVENNPQRTKQLFFSLLPLITRDRKLNAKEVRLALKIAVEDLRIPFQEAVDLMLDGISRFYAPLS